MNSRTNILRSGFTLIEMVIAMTVLALVVTVLFLAFSNAGRIWSRQETGAEQGEREAALLRLLSDDLVRIQPYNFSSERGRGFFFAVSEKALFYVTAAAYGAQERRPSGLYFTYCFLAENQEDSEEGEAQEGLTLYLIKEWGPKNYLLEALMDFQERPEAGLVLTEELRQAAQPVLAGLSEATFQVVADAEQLNLPDGEIAAEALIDKEHLPTAWTLDKLPAALLFSYRLEDSAPRRALLPLQPPPAPPAAEKKK